MAAKPQETLRPALFDEQAFAALLNDVEQRRAEFKQQRHISRDIIERFRELGLYRAFVPEQFGGSAMEPMKLLEIIERTCAVDGSTGWVVSFAFATKYLASLPAPTLAQIYAHTPDIIFAGAVYPSQSADVVDGGVRISGRWGFGSGCLAADLLGVGISVPSGDTSGLPLMAVLPADQLEIVESWDTFGMSGTGSHELVADDVFVPNDWILVRGAPATINTPIYRYPTLAYSAQVLGGCGLGIARGALDYVIGIAGGAVSITGGAPLGERANVQTHIGECEAKWRAARSWFYEQTENVWSQILAGEQVTREDNMALRLSSSHCARVGAEVTRACFEITGTLGIFNDNPLSYAVPDAMVVAQHAFLAEGSFTNAGKVLLDHPRIPGYD
ncbi:MAG: acyl-CoA dehydrogenase family protein [Pseudomonadota bacterium]